MIYKCKIICAALLSITMLFSLSSCGNSSSTNAAAAEDLETYADVDEGYKENGTFEVASDEVSEEIPEEIESEPEVTTKAFSHFKSTFSEGRAWVEYNPTGDTADDTHMYGLIDERGFVYLTTDTPGTPVSGGYTEVPQEDGFAIYTAEGGCSFSFTNTPELQRKVVGQGDGVFVVVEHATGFSGNVYYLYEIDGNGNEISARYEVASKHTYDPDPDSWVFSYLNSGIFACNSFFLYINNGILVDISNLNIFTFNLNTAFIDGVSVAKKTEQIINGPWDTICSISLDDLQSAEAVENWYNSVSSFGFYYDAVISNEGYMLHRVEPWGWEGSDGYYGVYDYLGNRLGVLPSFPSEVSIKEMGVFKNGYAPLLLLGADQFFYITMLNTAGEQQYDPICLGKNSSRGLKPELRWFAAYAGGDFVFDQHSFTGEDGYICIDAAGQSTYFEQLPPNAKLYDADENYFYFDGGCLTDHSGNIIFDSVKVTELENSEQKDTGEPQTKDYISVSDYTIEGKWKSVGDYGFGQAQPGAIVSFDGTHCNVYSPEDTYAFYKQGDDFILDCTGILSGTASFVVKIVDENHIDLHSGGFVTELTRVE